MATNSISECGFLRLDGRKKTPLFRQLYEQLRVAILQGRLKSNDRVPSSRDLMQQLGVSRTTVVTALNMLMAEGYLASRHGQGTFVSSEIPDQHIQLDASSDCESVPNQDAVPLHLSKFGRALKSTPYHPGDAGRPTPLCPGEPALDLFPNKIWSKIVRRVWNSITPVELSYGEPTGYFPLRTQVAEYLGVHRGVVCSPEQVMIVSGTQQAIDIISRLVLDRGDKVFVENPGYVSARDTFQNHAAKIVPVAVDQHGAAIRSAPKFRGRSQLVYVTPSHQFPIGVTMSIERRLELIEWASANDALILEDDYDSEYRYGQKPLPCLQGLDRSGRTVYVGSFSKVICPALGIGYAIVPRNLAVAFENVLRLLARPPSQLDQIVLSEYIREGHFVRHIRRMRKAHGQRRQVLVDALNEQVSGFVDVMGSSAGLHCTAQLKNTKRADTQVVAELAQRRVVARALSTYYCENTNAEEIANGLVLGFASSNATQIKRAVTTLRAVLETS